MQTMPKHDPRAVAVTRAIHDGDVDALRALLRDEPALATARIVDPGGVSRTLLHVVADWPGHFRNGAETVALLAAAGADLDAQVQGAAHHAETALHGAASSDDVAVLDALLDAGANIEAPGAVFTNGPALSDAVIFAQWNAARRLLARGAQTTFWQAAALGLLDRVCAFCEVTHEPAADAEQFTNALWHACRGGQREVAEYLVARGANADWIGWDHKTPLDVARESGNAALVEWLVARGARANRT